MRTGDSIIGRRACLKAVMKVRAGGGMRKLFISYARENKPDVEELARDLDALGYQRWRPLGMRAPRDA
jgi:hypothetical protein